MGYKRPQFYAHGTLPFETANGSAAAPSQKYDLHQERTTKEGAQNVHPL